MKIVREVIGTMIQNEYALKSKEVVNVIAIGDFHIGNSSFDAKFFKQMLKTIKDLPRKRIYLMGDCIEVASKNVGDSAFQQNCSVEEQREYFINNLEPFADDIVCYMKGNHENRLIKEYGFDIVKDMSRELGINAYHQHLDTFKINDFDFSIFTRHGKGSSQRKHLAMGKLEKGTQDIIADMYLEGHNHRLAFWNELKRFPQGYRRVYYGYTGHFLGYEGYPNQQYLQLELPSWQLITINQNRLVKCHQYFDEELI